MKLALTIILLCSGCVHHGITPRALSRLMTDSPDPFIIEMDVGDTIQESAKPKTGISP